jgi:preprotein translocase subunit SecG
LIYLLYGLFILTCIVLVVSVLLQPGKADAGALFTSSISSTAFGPRGTQTILAKITIISAALFMLLSLTLALVGNTGSRSIVQPDAEPAAQTQQQPQTAPSATEQQNQGAAPATGDSNTGADNPAPQSSPSSPAANANSGQ